MSDVPILITGGCGFIGTNLIAALVERGGCDITVLDNESLGKRANIAAYPVRFLNIDIAEAHADLAGAMAGVQVVVHLAAHTRVVESIADPDMNFRNNVVGTLRLLEASRDAGVRHFVNASTGGAVLGDAPVPVHEDIAPHPLAPYGASKLAAEGYCSAFSGSYGLPCASLRFSNVYGPRSYHKESVVAHFLRRILAGEELVIYGDGSQIRDYLYVGDLTDGIMRAIEAAVQGTYQLGAGRPTPLNELISIMAEVTGRDLKLRHEPARAGEVHTTWCDIARAREAFGYDPSTPLERGIRETWEWFLSRATAGREVGLAR